MPPDDLGSAQERNGEVCEAARSLTGEIVAVGTPKTRFIACGKVACASTKALLDTGADVTLLSREFAKRLGVINLPQAITMRSATGQSFQVQRGVVQGHLEGNCSGLLLVGITDRQNLGGKDAIIGNDVMGKKCMKIKFKPEVSGHPQSIKIGCGCQTWPRKQTN